jgi:hypothetical protein
MKISFFSKLKRVGPNSLGLTIPKDLADINFLEVGDIVYIQAEIEKEYLYKCGICKFSFIGVDNDECPACGEKHNLIINKIKGGDKR